MNHFQYRGSALYAEGVSLERIAREVGTPTYVYSEATLSRHIQVLDEAFASVPHLLCYSVKASSNLGLLRLFARHGVGFDIVSEGELRRVEAAAPASLSRVVFSGVGKRPEEMAAALKAGILLFNVESAEELVALDRVARAQGRRAGFALRVNPDVDARTHRYIATGLKTSKFGVPFAEARRLYALSRRMKGLTALGVDCHIGSQLTELAPLTEAAEKVADFTRALLGQGFPLRYLDIGGGLGITYRDEAPPSPKAYARAVLGPLKPLGLTVLLEPGRVLVGNAGVLLTRVLYRKQTPDRRFVIVDAGMNDLIRPALYEAHHDVLQVRKTRAPRQEVDLVGPVCESSDVLAKARRLPWPAQGELWAVMSAGAYGMSMASNYNSRLKPAEVLVRGQRYRVVRRRERWDDLWRGETA